ncbi:MAG: fatty acid desaturase [Verrucomicrobiaceae bacterium]|nr:MAG: fatty acid desaturase [Verrucomicrobiaceae bacterium]
MKTLPADVGEEPHWVSRQAFQIVVIMTALAEIGMFLILWNNLSLWWAVPVVLVIGHLMHGAAVGFHEASHGLLRRNRKFNEFDGVLIGLLSFMSFSLYRASHQSHHAHFTTEKDEELWPFVFTSSPRWFRVTVAFFELTFGMFFVPMLFLRSFLRKGSPIRSKKVRKRIWKEFALMGILWAIVIPTVWYFGVWKYFFWMYFIPTFIAGNLQSWRKYIEHVGLTGSTINSGTRNIVADTWTGKLVAFTLLHEPYHGLHHMHVGLPHAELPRLAPELEPTHPDEIHPFPSYRHAFLHLFRELANPRVGAQWKRVGEPQS